MKRTLHCWWLLIGLIALGHRTEAQTLFSKGVNLTGWFQAASPGQIQFTKYTKQDLANIKSLGSDVVRLPINLHSMTAGSPDYTLDPLFVRFLDSVVTWSEELEISLILDNHSFDPNINTTPQIENILLKVWPQMAEHYKSRSNRIIYEVLNEPHGITTQAWGQIQGNVINAIRKIDTEHTIIVGGSGYNTYTELQNIPVYTDTNLVYTFHFYDPFMFTHQGASWNTPSMVSLAGVPFPYDPASMPACPPDLLGTWVENALNNYPSDGTVAHVKSLLDIAVAFRQSRNVKIYCGEYGVLMNNADTSDRVYWHQVVREYLEEKGIPWTTWDYQGGFGLFNKGSNQLFRHDLNVPLLESLGFNVPPQYPFSIVPDTSGLKVYSDYIENGINDASYGSGSIDFYSTMLPDNDLYCLHWKGFSQYNTIGFDFSPDRDFSQLVAEDYALDMMVRGNESDIRFDARFLDTKTDDPQDHPWRMGVTIDASLSSWDNRWHHLHIPFSSFDERGAWDNGSWFNANGQFDWTTIDRFEFSTEYTGTSGNEIWFDNILITNLDTALVRQTGTLGLIANEMAENGELRITPNPVVSGAHIKYTLKNAGMVNLEIFSLSGSKMCSLQHGMQNAGLHEISWNGRSETGSDLMPGIYFCTLATAYDRRVCRLVKC